MSHRPTSIPLPTHPDPTATSPIPPTPSAFPSLSGDSPSTHSTAPQSTLHYAQVTGKVLPPTSIPKGVSLPPPPHQVQSTTSTSKERIQSSGQKHRDSPYARPGQGQRSNSGGQTGGGGGTGSTAQQRRKPTKPANGQSSSAKPKAPSTTTTEEKTPEDKHRNIPGMPSTWTAKTAKKPSSRRKSEGNPPAFDKDGVHLPGKKKIRTLKKVLPPANSKLSALAPTFEFVPRSATSPNLSAAAAGHESSSGSGSEESGEEHHEEEEETHEEQDEEPSPAVTDSSSLGSFLTSSFSLSDPESLATIDPHQNDEEPKDPAEGLVDEKLAGEIVSSSGPQADGFVGQTLTQSESGMKPDTDKTGFRSIPGVVNESPMADLEWKEKMGWWREDFAPEVKVTKDEETSGQEEEEEKEEKEEKEVKLAPAAIEANSNETPLLQFPPWKPSESSTSSTQAEDIDLSDSKVSPSILSKVLPDSFSDPPPVASTSSSTTESTSDSSSPSTKPSSTPSLSSFLPTSFTPPLSGYTSTSSSFLSQDELKAEKLSADGPNGGSSDEIPLSAEAVASQPTLDDALDVDEVKVGGSEKTDATGGKEKDVRKGWWNTSEGENETEKPQPNQAEHSDSMVDPELARETVESVPAQADGFVAKGFSEVDRVGEESTEGEREVKKDVEQNTREEESHQDIVEAEPENVKQENETREEKTETREEAEEEEEGKGSSTPLGSFLSSAFQPTDNSFSSSSTQVTQDEAAEPATDSTRIPTSSSSSKPAPPARRSSSPPPPPERRSSQSHAADSAPSLTLAISSAWHTAPWSRKIWAIIASVAINVGLPFVNGVMLGTLLSHIRHRGRLGADEIISFRRFRRIVRS